MGAWSMALTLWQQFEYYYYYYDDDGNEQGDLPIFSAPSSQDVGKCVVSVDKLFCRHNFFLWT